MELDALAKTFAGVKDVVLLAPDKINSLMEYTIRKDLRAKKVRLHMVKNTLARKVFKDNGVVVDDKHWAGTTLVAWGGDSIKDLSKAVDALIKDITKKNAKDADRLKVKVAVADGNTVTMAQAMTMPTRLEAIGDLINMILGPGSEIAGALTGPGSQLASQIASIAEGKEEEAPASPAA